VLGLSALSDHVRNPRMQNRDTYTYALWSGAPT